jgi:hypothetical protein
MSDQKLETCTYRILRYTPNLLRDEWVNIGVLLFDPAGGRLRARLLEGDAGLARVRRIHPQADIALLRALQEDFEAQIAASGKEARAWLSKMEETLSNVLQIGPQKGVLTADFDTELDRLYHDQVETPRYRGAAGAEREITRGTIRMRASDAFRRAGILGQFERGVRVQDFTTAGDPFRVDYSWRRNGTRGYVHALPIQRDLAQAKVLAFTADSVRRKMASAEFAAVTEIAPQPGNEKHAFLAGLFEEHRIDIIPVAGLDKYARDLRARLA